MKRIPQVITTCVVFSVLLITTGVQAQKIEKYFEKQDYYKAEEYCNKQKPEVKDACLLDLVKAYISINNIPKASKAAERMTDKGAAYFELGIAYTKSRQLDIAEGYFTKSDNKLDGYIMLADTFYRFGKYDEALKFYEKAYKNDQEKLYAAYEKVGTKLLYGVLTVDKGVAYYDKIKERYPQRSRELNIKIADAYVTSNRISQAEELYKDLYKDDPQALKESYDKIVKKTYYSFSNYSRDITKYSYERYRNLMKLWKYNPKSTKSVITPAQFEKEIAELEALLKKDDKKIKEKDVANINMNLYLLYDIQGLGDDNISYFEKAKPSLDTMGQHFYDQGMISKAIIYYEVVGVRDPESLKKANELSVAKNEIIDPYTKLLDEVYVELSYMNSAEKNAELFMKLKDIPDEYNEIWLKELNQIFINRINIHEEIKLYKAYGDKLYTPEMLFFSKEGGRKNVLMVASTTAMTFGVNYTLKKDSSQKTIEDIAKLMKLFHTAYYNRYNDFIYWGNMYSGGHQQADMYSKAKIYLNNMQLLEMQLEKMVEN